MSQRRPTVVPRDQLQDAAQVGVDLAVTDRTTASIVDPLATIDPVLVGRLGALHPPVRLGTASATWTRRVPREFLLGRNPDVRTFVRETVGM